MTFGHFVAYSFTLYQQLDCFVEELPYIHPIVLLEWFVVTFVSNESYTFSHLNRTNVPLPTIVQAQGEINWIAIFHYVFKIFLNNIAVRIQDALLFTLSSETPCERYQQSHCLGPSFKRTQLITVMHEWIFLVSVFNCRPETCLFEWTFIADQQFLSQNAPKFLPLVACCYDIDNWTPSFFRCNTSRCCWAMRLLLLGH